jgi:hypothetical protein
MATPPVVFLLGAGFSQAAGMESTSAITKQALSQNWRFTDGIWRPKQQSELDKDSLRERRLLVFLDRVLRRYYRRFSLAVEPNYEDLAYLAGQIEDGLLLEVDNPAIEPLVREVETALLTIFSKTEQDGTIDELIGDLAGSARHMIYDLAWSSLTGEPKELEGIGFVADLIKDADVSRCDIFTLNHDMVLEFLFRENDIEFSDGFGRYDETMRLWDPGGYDLEEPSTRLYKLHGSVNWLRYSGRLYGVPASEIASNYIADLRGPDDELPENLRPQILVGTFDKVLRYTEPQFLEMQCRMKQTLASSATITVCGYSFGDRGVNNQLVSWMLLNEEARMIVIHAEPRELKANARGAISKNWDEWEIQGKLTVIPRWAEDVKWEELKTPLET